jgi:hypothetical protein
MEEFITYDCDRDQVGITTFLNGKIAEGYTILSVTPVYYMKKMSGDLELRNATIHTRKIKL